MKRQSAVEKELRHQIEVIGKEIDALSKQIDGLTTRRTTMFDLRYNLEQRIRDLNSIRRKVNSNAPR